MKVGSLVVVFFFFSVVLLVYFRSSLCWENLLGQSPRYVFVGGLNLSVSSTGVGELVTRVGVLQIPPHPRHVRGDVVVAVLLRNNLQQERKRSCKFNIDVIYGVRHTIHTWVSRHSQPVS